MIEPLHRLIVKWDEVRTDWIEVKWWKVECGVLSFVRRDNINEEHYSMQCWHSVKEIGRCG